MSPVAVTQLPASRLHVDWTPVRDTLAALRAGHESLDLFVGQLFSGLESMRERLDQQDRRIKEERRQLAEERQKLATEKVQWQGQKQRNASESPSGERVAEAEHERAALEEELETVRQRCEELAGTVAEQKRQIAEERAEWTAEFRQLRKILDKQSQLLAQRMDHHAQAPLAVVPAAVACAAPNGSNGTNSNGSNGASVSNGANVPAARGAIDPVLGSVMNQFQLLQKDAARRRAQHAKNKAS
jgi:DNA repair exonuclease SbcCD ATPase subunit